MAQARDIEFDAVYAGDWMLHCHLPHHMMNNMVSMVGPMSHAGHGMQTGAGMEEGMGVVREGNALSEHLGPAMGRGMGITADRERSVSNTVAQQHEHHGAGPSQEEKKKVPGYPQDDLMMTMFMDKEVAKPETNGLAPGWSAALQGMMSLVRVLPPDKYEKIMAAIKQGKTEQPQSRPAHKHNEE